MTEKRFRISDFGFQIVSMAITNSRARAKSTEIRNPKSEIRF